MKLCKENDYMGEEEIIKDMEKDLLKQAQEDIKIWQDLYNQAKQELKQEKEKDSLKDRVIYNLAKAVKFMGTNSELPIEDIINDFSIGGLTEEIIDRWEKEQWKESHLKDNVIDLMAEDMADSGIYEDKCQMKIDSDECKDLCEDCIKQYYFKKARGEKGE